MTVCDILCKFKNEDKPKLLAELGLARMVENKKFAYENKIGEMTITKKNILSTTRTEWINEVSGCNDTTFNQIYRYDSLDQVAPKELGDLIELGYGEIKYKYDGKPESIVELVNATSEFISSDIVKDTTDGYMTDQLKADISEYTGFDKG